MSEESFLIHVVPVCVCVSCFFFEGGDALEHDGYYTTNSQGRHAATHVCTLHICKCTHVEKYACGRMNGLLALIWFSFCTFGSLGVGGGGGGSVEGNSSSKTNKI